MSARVRWLAADQLGPHFDDGGKILLIENHSVWARRPYHRAKALVILSAMRHRAAELEGRAEVVSAPSYREALAHRLLAGESIEVIAPTSHGLRARCQELAGLGLAILPSRGFVTSEQDFASWLGERDLRGLAMDAFYRWWRGRSGVLMTGPNQPVGGTYSFDADNRLPPPRGAARLGLPKPYQPVEDEIDAAARRDLATLERSGAVRLIGDDGPRRFAVTRAEALLALEDFVTWRLDDFGPYEDAMLRGDVTMAHSLLSVPLNLGLLHPVEVIDRVLQQWQAGRARLSSVEGVIRQLAGWRDWVWHLYWQLGSGYVDASRGLTGNRPLPDWFWRLDHTVPESACLADVLGKVRSWGWAHHIERLMVLGNFGLQRGFSPRELNEWFVSAFVDATPWVMPANVVGMSLYADGGQVATKPYAAGGAYLSRMSDYCGSCRFNPKHRLGDDACVFTAGYWAFLDRAEPQLRGNHRMAKPLGGLRALGDREAIRQQEERRDRLGQY